MPKTIGVCPKGACKETLCGIYLRKTKEGTPSLNVIPTYAYCWTHGVVEHKRDPGALAGKNDKPRKSRKSRKSGKSSGFRRKA